MAKNEIKTEPKGIHLTNGALDEIATSRGQQIVLRGVIDPASLSLLKVDEYQREPLPLSALAKLWQALRDGESLPDIELAMRSTNFESVKGTDEFWLPADKVYIIDGQQRRNAAMHILSIMPNLPVRLGAMIHFGTTREWERDRFKILNLERSRVSPNVLLRNMRHQSAAVLTLYGICHNEPKFALFERVCWKQSRSQDELITARTLATIAGVLHLHRSPGYRHSLNDLVPALDRQAKFVKLQQWRQNIIYFFDLIDECWGIRQISMRELSLQIRTAFLIQVALVLSDHCNFWRGDHETELYVEQEWRKRFRTFPLHDPAVVQIISSAGAGYGSIGGSGMQSMLYSLLRDHLNKGLSTNRLHNRKDEQAAKANPSFADPVPGMNDVDDEEFETPEH
jgi:hypothetical protein